VSTATDGFAADTTTSSNCSEGKVYTKVEELVAKAADEIERGGERERERE
jgi:hypothetical protein